MIWVENGKGGFEVIHPMVFVEFFVPGLFGLQVHQVDRNRLRLMISASGDRELVAAAYRAAKGYLRIFQHGKHYLRPILFFAVINSL